MAIDLLHVEASRDCGLLLIGHGSREAIGTAEFLATVELVAKMAGGIAVEPSFLEFARPTIAQGFESLAARGARSIVAVPVLLFSAGHAQRDIPAALATVATTYPHVAFEQAEHLGCHDAILELSKLRYDECLARHATVSAAETALVMVGRGSHERSAKDEMLRFAALRGLASGVATSTCFLSMAEPDLESVLDELAAARPKRVVVQPHLLFGGVLVDRITCAVARYAEAYPQVQWLTTGYLGPSPLLARAICQRSSAVPAVISPRA